MALSLPVARPNDRPTEEEIRTFVVEKVGKEWRSVCTYLGIAQNEIDMALANNPRNVKEAFFSLLVIWRNGKVPDRPVTWAALLRAMENAGLAELCEDITQNLKIGPSKAEMSKRTDLTETGSLSPQSSVSSECDIWHPLINEYFDLCRTILKNYQKEREPPLDELIAFCRYLLRCGRKSSDAVQAQVILKGANPYRELEEVVIVMTKWLSFSFLERIVERFPTTSAKSSLEEYKSKLHPVLEEKLTSLKRIQKEHPEESGTKEGFLKLSVRYNWDADGITLEDVLESRRFLCSSLGIPDHLLQVLRVLIGSVIVEYLTLREFEREISEKVVLLLRHDKMAAGFLRNGIVSLTIGGTVYNILKIANEKKFSAVKSFEILLSSELSSELQSKWQMFIHSLYDVHVNDPLPAEYEYLMDKYRKAGQVMRTEEMRPVVMRPVVMGLGMMGPEEMRLEEMRPEEMAYAEWFLLHKLPEVTRALRLDPWALLMSATSSYRTRSYFTPFPSHSDRTLSTLFPSHSDRTLSTLFPSHSDRTLSTLFPSHSDRTLSTLFPSHSDRTLSTLFPSHSDRILSTLFPSHSDHIQRLSVRPSIRILRDIGIRGIKREMHLDIAMESSEIESALATIREEFPLATLTISSVISNLSQSEEEEFFLALFKALKGRASAGYIEKLYSQCSVAVPSYYKEDLDRAYQSVNGGDKRSDTGKTQLATSIGQMPSSSASEGKVLKVMPHQMSGRGHIKLHTLNIIGSKEDVPSSDLAEVKRSFQLIIAEFMRWLLKEDVETLFGILKAFKREDSPHLLSKEEIQLLYQESTFLQLCNWYECGFMKALSKSSTLAELTAFEEKRNTSLNLCSVAECFPSGPLTDLTPPPGYGILKVTIAGLLAIRELWTVKEAVMSALDLPPHSLLLRGYQSGSVVAVFFITQLVQPSEEVAAAIRERSYQEGVPLHKITFVSHDMKEITVYS